MTLHASFPLDVSGSPLVDRSPTVAEQVHRHLRHELLLGSWPPGTRLREAELAERFGVSRTPIREAFKQLQQQGLLEAHPTQGVRVRRPELATALDAYDLRVELEGMAARLAAERADVDGRAALTLLLEQVEASEADDVAAQVEADLAFHRTVAKLSASEPLQLALETLAGHLTPLKVLTRDQNASATTRIQHRTIATAIQRGDGSEAERAMRDHVLHFRSIVASRYTSESQVMP